jgi:hypothetical protein
MPDPYTPDDYTRFTLRINTALLEQIKTIAELEKRSTAKQIELILEQYLRLNNSKEHIE